MYIYWKYLGLNLDYENILSSRNATFFQIVPNGEEFLIMTYDDEEEEDVYLSEVENSIGFNQLDYALSFTYKNNKLYVGDKVLYCHISKELELVEYSENINLSFVHVEMDKKIRVDRNQHDNFIAEYCNLEPGKHKFLTKKFKCENERKKLKMILDLDKTITVPVYQITENKFTSLAYSRSVKNKDLDEDIRNKIRTLIERLHNIGIVHLDLILDNFVINLKTKDVRLIDFETSVDINDENDTERYIEEFEEIHGEEYDGQDPRIEEMETLNGILEN